MDKSTEKALRLYEKAQDAFKKNNYPYAINLLFNTIEVAPHFVKARHLLHLIEKKKLEHSKVVMINRALGNILNIPFYILGYFYFLKGDYAKAMIYFEKILLRDPVNTPVLKSIGDSSLKLEMIETAIDTFETIRTLIPSDIKNLRKLGDIYKDLGNDLGKAKECYTAILQYDKNNHAARKGLSDVAALQTIEVGSYDDLSSSFLTKVKDLEFADVTEKKMRAVKSEEDLRVLIKDTEKEYEKEPRNVKIIVELASYYLQAKEYDSTIAFYKKARAVAPEDYTLTKLLMDAEIAKIDSVLVDLINQKVSTEGAEKKIKELQDLKSKTFLSYLMEMVSERPSDRELRYQLGRVYFENSKIDDAIKEFQLAVSEPRYRLRAYNYLGLCFSSKKMYDLAEVQFNSALQELTKTSHIDEFSKEVLYNLASVYERMGHIDKAVEKYKEIYKVDIGFKDVSEKIHKTYNK